MTMYLTIFTPSLLSTMIKGAQKNLDYGNMKIEVWTNVTETLLRYRLSSVQHNKN